MNIIYSQKNIPLITENLTVYENQQHICLVGQGSRTIDEEISESKGLAFLPHSLLGDKTKVCFGKKTEEHNRAESMVVMPNVLMLWGVQV